MSKDYKFAQFHRLSANFGVTLSLIRSRKEKLIKKEGCTAAAAMYSVKKNLMQYFISGSGDAPVKCIFPGNFTAPIPQVFKASISSDGKGKCYFRGKDAEFKLLNVIAGILSKSQCDHMDGGWVLLQIEQPPCDSCARVINEFSLKFPTIKLTLEHTTNIRTYLKNINSMEKSEKDFDLIRHVLEIRKKFYTKS